MENGSRDGAEALVEALPARLNARYMHRERGNKSYALNEALETIADGLVVFFDDDVEVDSKLLLAYDHAARPHIEQKRVFFGGPVEARYETEPPANWLRTRFPSSIKGYDLKSSRMAPNKFIGFNWAAFKHDIQRLGGFDTRFGPGSKINATGQEDEMQARLLADGATSCDVPDAIVSHYVPVENTTMKWLLKRRIRDGVSREVRSDRSAVSSIFNILHRILICVGVLAKGVLIRDKEKISIALITLSLEYGRFLGVYYKLMSV
jgi:glycosyltransferase involved in cell wall biosynthesis